MCKYYLGPLLERLRLHAEDPVKYCMPRVLVSCKSMTMVNAIFHHLRDELGALAYLPPGGDPGNRDFRDCLLLRIFSEHDPVVKAHVFDPNSHSRLLLGTEVLDVGHDFEGMYDLISIGLVASMMHFRQHLGRPARCPGEVGHVVVLHNVADYKGVEESLVNMVLDKKKRHNKLIYKDFGEVFDPAARDCCCSNCGRNKGIPVVHGVLPPCDMPDPPIHDGEDMLFRTATHGEFFTSM
jgi:hypothetical protein